MPREKGLRQAEAVFQHVRNLPQLLEEGASPGMSPGLQSAEAEVSAGSYMPVFKTGKEWPGLWL